MPKEKNNCFCVKVKYDDPHINDDLSDDDFIDDQFECQIRGYEFDTIGNISSSSFEFSSDDNGSFFANL